MGLQAQVCGPNTLVKTLQAGARRVMGTDPPAPDFFASDSRAVAKPEVDLMTQCAPTRSLHPPLLYPLPGDMSPEHRVREGCLAAMMVDLGRVSPSQASRSSSGSDPQAKAMTKSVDKRADLLPRIAAGDVSAVSECLGRYNPLVWSLARKLSSDVATLEDVVQEIFIEIWKSAGRFDATKASETTFIATIARRRIIDRSRKVSRAPLEENIEDTTVSATDGDLAMVDLGDDARVAKDVLAKLRPEQRRVILMSVVDGLTHQEISQSTGMPLGTVKSHIRRGLDRAAEMMRSSRKGQQT